MFVSLRSSFVVVCLSGAVSVLPAFAQNQIPRPAHVVVVVEENKSYSRIIGSAATPYINSLSQQGALFTASFAIGHPSEPNYLALFSGSTQGVTDDSCPHTFNAPNLGGELLGAGFTFAGYSEDLPSVGFTGCGSGGYARKHNPWVNFPDVPPVANQPFTSWPSDFNALPAVAFVVPNLDNDMHDGSVSQGDVWLREHLDAYATWAQTNNSLLILTWDEDDRSQNNRVATIFFGPMVQPGVYSGQINHYNVLRTLEEMFGLSHAGESGSATPILNVWKTPNTAMTVRLQAPVNESVFRPGTEIILAAAVSDSTAAIEKVEFFAGNTKLGESVGPDYTFAWSDAQPGVYSLNAKATNARGEVASSTPIELTVQSPAAAFARAKGSYSGLFFDPNGIANSNSGAFTLTTTDRGTFTGQLQMAGKRYSWSGQLDSEGRASNTIARAGSSPLTIDLRVGLFDHLDETVGHVSDGVWSAELAGDRAAFDAKTNAAPFAGKYTLVIRGAADASTSPGGDGAGSLTVDGAGKIIFKGTLADGTKVSQKSAVSKHGQWPLYLSLYGGGGSVLSWVSFTNRPGSDLEGAISWIKPPQAAPQLYPAGFDVQSDLIGSAYSGVNPVFNFTNGIISFTGGDLAEDFSNAFAISAANKIVNLNSNRLSLKLTASSGLFSGTVTPPAGGKPLPFNGAVLQKQNNASGFFLGPGRSGHVLISPGV